MAKQDLSERFWSKVNMSGGADACWLWTAGKDRGGYGSLTIDGRTAKAHRVALQFQLGRAMVVGTVAMHTCDVPACVNPGHLREGSKSDNQRDCGAKGRSTFQRHPELCLRGENNHAAKLTALDVLDIRRHHDLGGRLTREFCARYSVSRIALLYVAHRKTWRHLP